MAPDPHRSWRLQPCFLSITSALKEKETTALNKAQRLNNHLVRLNEQLQNI